VKPASKTQERRAAVDTVFNHSRQRSTAYRSQKIPYFHCGRNHLLIGSSHVCSKDEENPASKEIISEFPTQLRIRNAISAIPLAFLFHHNTTEPVLVTFSGTGLCPTFSD
jgi:hypothetical protein